MHEFKNNLVFGKIVKRVINFLCALMSPIRTAQNANSMTCVIVYSEQLIEHLRGSLLFVSLFYFSNIIAANESYFDSYICVFLKTYSSQESNVHFVGFYT